MAENDNKPLDPKISFLCEMFENIDIDVLIELVQSNKEASIEQLVEKCLILNETADKKKPDLEPQQTEFVSEVTLVPIFTQDESEVELDSSSEQEKNMQIDPPDTLFEILFEHVQDMKSKRSLKTILACVNTCKKCLTNILKNPANDKFRMIKRDHPMVQSKILSVPGGLEFFEMVGWTDSDGLLLFSNGDVAEIFNISQSLENLVETFTVEKEQEQAKLLVEAKAVGGKGKRKAPVLATSPSKKKLTAEEVRERRLAALSEGTTKVDSNYQGRGPRAGRKYKPGKKNFKQDLKHLRKSKARKWSNQRGRRKRVFTMNDIAELTTQDKDYASKGLERNDFLNNIGKEALRLTNEFRAEQGLQPLLWSQPMADVGLVHSRDMGDGRVPFSHQGFHERVKQFPHRSVSAAENVAMSHGLSSVAKTAVDGWIDSPGHRKNLLSKHRWCGIGVYRNASGAYYLTQLFAVF